MSDAAFQEIVEAIRLLSTATASTTVTAPLQPLFIASQLVELAHLKNEMCSVALQPLNTFPMNIVGICGHVFGPSAMMCSQCPLCKQHTGWTCVECTKNN